jgi:hypothetical protein
MPIPEEQLRKLDGALWEHEVRMKVISRSIRSMEAEKQAHEALLKLGQSQQVREALGEIYDDPEAGRSVVDDPAAFFRTNGIDLGDTEVTVALGDQNDENVLEVRFQQASISYSVAWHRSEGFMLMGV